jgi:hypothetical protein
MSKLARWGVCCGVGLAGVAVVGAAHAQEAPDADASSVSEGHEALQLTLQGSLADYQKQSITPDAPAGSSVQPAEQSTSTTGFGILGSGLGVGIGYAWDRLLFGARVDLTTVKLNAPGIETTATRISLLPRFEYMFTLDAARPFLAGIVGVEHSSTSTPVALGGNIQSLDDASTSFAIGGAFGVHSFLSRSVSLDPEFTVMYAAGSGSLQGAGPSSSVDYSVHSVRVLFSLGLSGWIDTAGAPPALPPRAEDADAAPDRAVAAPSHSAAAAAPPANEPELKEVSADIQLPNARGLTLRLSQDPASPSVLVRLTESRYKFALSHCDSVLIPDQGAPIPLVIGTHGEHYLTGRLPVHGLEVLAGNADVNLTVCDAQWQLDQPAREAVQGFLNARRALLPHDSPAGTPAPEAPPAPPPAASNAAPPPPVAPSAAFPARPEAAPAAPVKHAPTAPGGAKSPPQQ